MFCANQQKKNIDEIPPIHINFYLKSSSLICQSYISNLLVILSTHVCASMFKNSHFIKQKWSRHNFSILPIYGKIICLLPLLLYEKKITTTKKEQNMKMVVEIVVTGLRKRKAHFIYQLKIFLFNPPKKRNNPWHLLRPVLETKRN